MPKRFFGAVPVVLALACLGLLLCDADALGGASAGSISMKPFNASLFLFWRDLTSVFGAGWPRSPFIVIASCAKWFFDSRYWSMKEDEDAGATVGREKP